MKHILLLTLIIHYTADMSAQKKERYANHQIPICRSKNPSSALSRKTDKPIIDSTAIRHWVGLGRKDDIAISNSGQYVAYSIQNMPFNSSTLVVQSATEDWKKEFHGASAGFFSEDSKQYIFKIKDTLCFLSPGTGLLTYVTDVANYQQPYPAKAEWLAWQLKNNPEELILHNLLTGKELRYPSITAFAFSKDGKGLVLQTVARNGATVTTRLLLVTLPEGRTTDIWSTNDKNAVVNSFAVDNSGTQVTFMVKKNNSAPFASTAEQPENTIWYYKIGMEKAIVKANNQSNGIEQGLQIQEAPSFSDDGRYIFFGLQNEKRKPKPDAVNLDVWHYGDTELQSAQLIESPQTYAAVIGTKSDEVIQLQHDFEVSSAPPKGDFIVITKNSEGDRFWLNQLDTTMLVSMKDGSRKVLKTAGRSQFWFSPSGNYLIYSDAGQHNNYFSYDLKTGRTINISATIPAGQLVLEDEFRRSPKTPAEILKSSPTGIAGWLEADAGLLVYDNYDIWLLDTSGKRRPVNITNGYGRSHLIKFRITEEGWDSIFKSEKPLLLVAFNTINKENGFYKKELDKTGDPVVLTMGPYVFNLQGSKLYTPNGHDYDRGIIPMKARDFDIWLVKRQSNTEAPNYFLTTDFIRYRALTTLQPQTVYNWVTADLVNFKQLDGTISQGVLYKPENFDSTKKYPVLFNYYEQLSHRLYQYPRPDFTSHNIDVAWFVSRGYLVFTPDIYFTKKKNGWSAYNTLVGAAQHLSKLPYIDASKMGINGHSVGGGLTNYIITHTNYFAAAVEGAGSSDIISSALQLSAGKSRLWGYEYNKGSLWQNTNLWLAESPIMKADKITTPLIIFHSKVDSAVPWEQAVELFVALRRLGKKVWMLQYDNADHAVDGKDAEDYTIRITQFFDHYLKGAPPAKWMTKGIPARLKGIDDGLELDTSLLAR